MKVRKQLHDIEIAEFLLVACVLQGDVSALRW